jgi:type IV pilus assembly protein PilC
MEFSYKAKDAGGRTVEGTVEAATKEKALSLLKERGFFVIDLREGGGMKIDLQNLSFGKKGKVSADEVVVFTRQLSTMVNAGLPINDALFSLKEQVSPKFAPTVEEILRKVEGGMSLGEALAGYPHIFNQAYIASVKSGEAAGVLDKVLLRLAEDMEEEKNFRGNIKGAMIYPVIVIVAMVVVAIIMMVAVIPRMTSLYSELGADLPTPTKILMAISGAMVRFWWIVLIILAVAVYGFIAFRRTPEGAKQIDRLILKLPIVGPLQEKTNLTNIARTLSLLVETGLPLVEALDIVAGVANNSLFRETIKAAARGVEKGRSLSEMLSLSGEIIPPIFYQMVAVGEGTGNLDEALAKVATYFKSETEAAIKGLTAAIEPIIMIILGLGVGFLVIAVIMPIYNLTSQF